ncbi:pre-mRNA 3' end processing protein WDR33 isoform X1 [Halyomorpha halys]|uniref:pre-mRNA 3' end processing protein WDR33 isoform X1 n=1 Tax=Halyomorpha halys TaxID=286706 RepID=UPI0006D5047C|nr:pre-mRNA 3' end processing protein WDR33 isoform X1 [Halyomorpha halys]
MITITPNTNPINNINQTNRYQPNGNAAQRFQNPARQNFFQPFRAYRQGGNGPLVFDPEFDGKRLRKSAMRKTVDYNAAIIKMLEARVWQRDYRDRRCLQPDAMFIPDLMPPSIYEDNPINAVTTRFVKTATNKMRCPIFCMAWTPEGRRLVTGASSGEFTLWNGLTFNFETILQAHDTPVRTMVWSHNEMWMVTADHAGYVKYWQSNMNNVKMFMAHQDAIRGISFSPSDSKFASCSDDGTIKIWDFYRCQEERTLRGHGADVKCVHWHPQKALIISGSKDNQQPVKLWDPKSGSSLATIHAHKSTVMDVKWNNNGNWFVTASRDHLLKLFDIRNVNTEVQVFRGHKKEASSVAWHPIHEGLFCSGGSDGAILFWHVGAEKEVGAIEQAHDSIVWTLAWHPMGHILCSGSNDHTSKFWTRNRPGDSMRDKYNLNTIPASLSGLEETEIDEVQSVIPGMGPEDKVEVNTSPLPGLTPGSIPGLEDLDLSAEDKGKTPSKKVPYSKPIPKNFQAHWNDTGKLEDIDDDSRDGLDPIALINQLIEQQPGVKLVKDLEPEALYIYGKVLTVEPGSALAKAISEGGEKLMKYLNSGAVKELRDVIPHYDDNADTFIGDSDPDDNDQEMDIIEDTEPSLPITSSPSPIPPMPMPPVNSGPASSASAMNLPPLMGVGLGSGPGPVPAPVSGPRMFNSSQHNSYQPPGMMGGPYNQPPPPSMQQPFEMYRAPPPPPPQQQQPSFDMHRDRRAPNYWQEGDYDDKRSEDSRDAWEEDEDYQENGYREYQERPSYPQRGNYSRNRRGWYRGSRQQRGLTH